MLRDTIEDLLGKGQKKILLNLSDVNHIDSSGVGALLRAFTSVRNQGGELKLLHVTKKVHNMLQNMKLYTKFDVRGRRGRGDSCFRRLVLSKPGGESDGRTLFRILRKVVLHRQTVSWIGSCPLTLWFCRLISHIHWRGKPMQRWCGSLPLGLRLTACCLRIRWSVGELSAIRKQSMFNRTPGEKPGIPLCPGFEAQISKTVSAL